MLHPDSIEPLRIMLIHDIEKIEPMKIALGSFIGDTFGQETRLAEKLNEVIENQNKIIDYLNGMVKKR